MKKDWKKLPKIPSVKHHLVCIILFKHETSFFFKGEIYSTSHAESVLCSLEEAWKHCLSTVWRRGLNRVASARRVAEFGSLFPCLHFSMLVLHLAKLPSGLRVSTAWEFTYFPCSSLSSTGVNRQSPMINLWIYFKK